MINKINIIRAEAKHLPSLKKLYWGLQCFEATYNPDVRITEKARYKHYRDMEKTFTEGNSVIYIAESEDKKVVGYIEAYDYGREYSTICDVFIQQKFRNKGIGRKLFEATFSELKKEDIERFVYKLIRKIGMPYDFINF